MQEGLVLVRERSVDRGISLEVKPQTEVIKQMQDRLEKLGFKSVTKRIDVVQRMAIAYKLYEFVTPEKIKIFNEKLKRETLQEDKRAYHYKTLVFTPIEEYKDIPSEEALIALEQAQTLNIFDGFAVAKIDWKEEVKDPIIFGKIQGCEDFFFISQWDDDIRVEDIMFCE